MYKFLKIIKNINHNYVSVRVCVCVFFPLIIIFYIIIFCFNYFLRTLEISGWKLRQRFEILVIVHQTKCACIALCYCSKPEKVWRFYFNILFSPSDVCWSNTDERRLGPGRRSHRAGEIYRTMYGGTSSFIHWLYCCFLLYQ